MNKKWVGAGDYLDIFSPQGGNQVIHSAGVLYLFESTCSPNSHRWVFILQGGNQRLNGRGADTCKGVCGMPLDTIGFIFQGSNQGFNRTDIHCLSEGNRRITSYNWVFILQGGNQVFNYFPECACSLTLYIGLFIFQGNNQGFNSTGILYLSEGACSSISYKYVFILQGSNQGFDSTGILYPSKGACNLSSYKYVFILQGSNQGFNRRGAYTCEGIG